MADNTWTAVLAMLNTPTLDGRMVAVRAPFPPKDVDLPIYYTPSLHGGQVDNGGKIKRVWLEPTTAAAVPLWLYASGTASGKLDEALKAKQSPWIHVDFAADTTVSYSRQSIYGANVVVCENFTVTSALAYSAGWPNFIQAKIWRPSLMEHTPVF